MSRNVPLRFQAHCDLCGDEIDLRNKGNIYQLTTGYVKVRAEGGGNAVALPRKHLNWACKLCIEDQRRGQAKYQMGLFT